MTIRFLQSWAGYSTGQIATLAGVEETRLIGIGLAASYPGTLDTDYRGDAEVVLDTLAGVAAKKAANVPYAAGTVAQHPVSGAVLGVVDGFGNLGKFATDADRVVPSMLQTGDLAFTSIDNTGITLPNPYEGSQVHAPIHPATLFFPSGQWGYRYWMAFTPYPGAVSDYENPTVAASNDGITWVAMGRQPLVDKPSDGYNADPHIFMSSDNTTMYLMFRERATIAATNRLKLMHTTDGVNWSTPVTLLSGSTASQDFASPSCWWNGTGWTLISHNLDAASPWPVQRRVSSTADPYGAWGSASTVTIAPFSGRAWWHTFHVRLSSGQIVALCQDNSGGLGGTGYLYWAESNDDGATYVVGEPCFAGFGDVAGVGGRQGYRSSFVAYRDGADTVVEVFFGDFRTKGILRHFQRAGRVRLRDSFLSSRAAILAAGTTLPNHALWSDTFTRADSAVSIGTASGGGTYTVSSGTWGIRSNQAYAVASGRLLLAAGQADHKISVRFADMTNGVQQWMIARAVDGSNYWRCGVVNPVSGSSQTLILQSVVSAAIERNWEIGTMRRGDVLTLTAKGSVLRISVDGVLVHEHLMHVALAGTNCGLQSNAGASSNYDDLVVVKV